MSFLSKALDAFHADPQSLAARAQLKRALYRILAALTVGRGVGIRGDVIGKAVADAMAEIHDNSITRPAEAIRRLVRCLPGGGGAP
jgi:hypothetical protein